MCSPRSSATAPAARTPPPTHRLDVREFSRRAAVSTAPALMLSSCMASGEAIGGVLCMVWSGQVSSSGHERVHVVSLCNKLTGKTAGPGSRGRTGEP